MNDTDIIEGIDYIFDRYAFLNVEENSTLDIIKTEIRKKRAGNHPDKLTYASDEIKALAKRQLELVDECERILTNEAIRPLYDAKLKEFKENEPALVSTTGTAIINPGKFKVHINYLINEDITDLSELETRAQQQTGYNEKKLNKARKQHSQDNDEESREELYSQLTLKLVYLSVLEDFYWQKAGVSGAVQNKEHFMVQSTSDIQNLFDAKISNISQNVQQAVADRNGSVLLGFTKPLLLANSVNKTAEADDSQTQLVVAAIKNFEMRAEDLKKLMDDKKGTIDELTTVSRVKQIKEINSPVYDIFLISNPEYDSDDEIAYLWPKDNINLIGLAIRVNTETEVVINFPYPESVLTQEAINAWPHNIYIVDVNQEIDAPLIEPLALAQRLVDAFKNKD